MKARQIIAALASCASLMAMAVDARSSSPVYSLWRVKGVALGAAQAVPCRPDAAPRSERATHAIASGPECSFGEERDSTRVTFSADKKQVVRVVRTQYLSDSDPNTSDIISEAVRFYGRPVLHEPKNEVALFGNAFGVVRRGAAWQISRNQSGVGLLIKGQPCGDGSFGLKDCKGLGTRYITYELVNHPEMERLARSEKKALQDMAQRKLSSLTF